MSVENEKDAIGGYQMTKMQLGEKQELESGQIRWGWPRWGGKCEGSEK